MRVQWLNIEPRMHACLWLVDIDLLLEGLSAHELWARSSKRNALSISWEFLRGGHWQKLQVA